MANNTETLKLIISGDGKLLGAALTKSEQQIKGFESKTIGAFSRIGKGISTKLKSIAANPLTIVGGTAGIMAAGKALIDYDSDLTRLAINAEMSSDKIMQLRKEIDDVAFASGQSRPELFLGINKIVEQTGDLQFARDVMQDLAIASTASGAGMEYMGALAVQLRDKMKMSKEEIKQSLNLLNVQGKAGAYTLENMATMGERLFAAAGRFNMQGIGDLSKFGAFLQVARMGTGSSEQATTSVENVIADILDKSKEIKKIGFDIFMPTGELKKFDEIIKGIIVNTKGNEVLLGNIFGRESIRAISTLAAAYRDTKGFDLFDKLTTADAGKATALMQDFAQYSASAKFQLMQLGNIAWDFADAALAPVINDITKSLRSMTSDPEKIQQFRDDVHDLGEKIGGAADNVFRMVDAMSKFLPLLKMAGGAADVAGWFLMPNYSGDSGDMGKTMGSWFKGLFKNDSVAGSRSKQVSLSTPIINSQVQPSATQSAPAINNQVQNSVNISLSVTDSGKVVAQTNDPNTKVVVNNRGSFRGIK